MLISDTVVDPVSPELQAQIDDHLAALRRSAGNIRRPAFSRPHKRALIYRSACREAFAEALSEWRLLREYRTSAGWEDERSYILGCAREALMARIELREAAEALRNYDAARSAR